MGRTFNASLGLRLCRCNQWPPTTDAGTPGALSLPDSASASERWVAAGPGHTASESDSESYWLRDWQLSGTVPA